MSTHTFSITARRAAAKSRNGEERAYALASSTASSIAVTGDYLTREEFERLFEKIPVEGDEANSFVIKAKASLYTDGWLSAKGPAEESTSGSSGSSGIDLQAMWAALAASDTSKKISNTHLALHPLTINGTTYDPSSASAVVNITAHQEIHKLTFSAGAFSAGTFEPTLADASISVPTKTSHLTNDSGYVTSTSLNTAWADYVTLATAQTITGVKTFSQKIVIGSATIEWDSANSALKVSHSLYSDGWLSAKGPADGSSGSGSSSSGGLDTAAMWQALASADTSKKISNTHLSLYPLTINGTTYDPASASATISITASSLGALTAHQAIYDLTFSAGAFSAGTYSPKSAAKTISVPTHTSHLTNNSGFITASASITGNAATATNADMVDNVHLAALQRALYTYTSTDATAADTTLLPNILGYGTGISGFRYFDTKFYNTIATTANRSQMAYGYDEDSIYFRRYFSGEWSDWKQLAFTDSNVTSATKLQTARTIWGQNFDGTASVSGDMTGVGSITASGSIIVGANGISWDGRRMLYSGSYNGGVAQAVLNNSNSPYGLLTRIYGNGAVSLQSQRESAEEYFPLYLNPLGGYVGIGTTSPSYALDVTGSVRATGGFVGNADSATKLATPRTLWGQSFDGSANVSGSLTGVTTISHSGVIAPTSNNSIRLGSADNNYAGVHSRQLISNVSDAIMWLWQGAAQPMAFATNAAERMRITADGYVGIGTASPSTKLHVAGNGYFSGWLTAAAAASSSDMRLKRDIRERALTLGEMLAMRPVEFRWTGNGEGSYGAIAQEVEGVCPSLVHTDCQGYKSLAYGNLGVALGLSLARLAKEAISRLDDHEKRISKLETLCQ